MVPISHWQVIYTMPKAEVKLFNSLVSKGIEVFLPLTSVVVQWSDRKKKVNRPLFPNYVFVRPASLQDRNLIFSMSGFVRFLTTKGKVDVIPEYEIEVIQRLMKNTPTIVDNQIGVGTDVVITQGHFSGLKGKLLRKNGINKLLIELQSLRQCLVVEISAAHIAEMSNPPLQLTSF